MEGEWHFGETGALVRGPKPIRRTPIWFVPGVPTAKAESDYGMSFC